MPTLGNDGGTILQCASYQYAMHMMATQPLPPIVAVVPSGVTVAGCEGSTSTIALAYSPDGTIRASVALSVLLHFYHYAPKEQ